MDDYYEPLCVATVGSVDAGKSTLLGVFKTGKLETKEDPLIKYISKHQEEIDNERTSDIAVHRVVLNDKPVTFIDLAGHESYLKNTIYGMTGHFPDYAILVVGCNKGILPMTKEHMGILVKLNIPFVIACSKEDLTHPDMYKKLKSSLTSYFRKTNGLKPFFINKLKKKQMENDVKKDDSFILHVIKKRLILNNIEYNDIVSSLKYKEIITNDESESESIINLIKRYMCTDGCFDKNPFSYDFIKETVSLSSEIRTSNFYRILDDDITVDEINSLEKNILSHVTHKGIIKRITTHFESLRKYLKKKSVEIQGDKRELIINELDNTVELYGNKLKNDLERISNEYTRYCMNSTSLSNYNLSKNERDMIEDTVSKIIQLRELKSLHKIDSCVDEFKLNPNLVPVFTISSKTGYFIESFKRFLSKLPKKKHDWNETDETNFYIDTVYGFKGGRKHKQLHFDGFVVSGILRGSDISVDDDIMIGPYKDVFVKGVIKSMHDDDRNNIKTLHNKQRGCLGVQITDQVYTEFDYKFVKKGMSVIKSKKIMDKLTWNIVADVQVNRRASLCMKSGFRPMLHMGNIKQTVSFQIPDNKIIRPGDKGRVIINFTQHPELIEDGHKLFLFREGQTRGHGRVVSTNTDDINKVTDFNTEQTVKNIKPKYKGTTPI